MWAASRRRRRSFGAGYWRCTAITASWKRGMRTRNGCGHRPGSPAVRSFPIRLARPRARLRFLLRLHPLDQDLVHAVAVHVHDFVADVVLAEMLSGLGDAAELHHHETAQGLVG